MANFKDTYFLNSQEALKVAKQNNQIKLSSGVKGTQLCFYNGEKIINAPKNCINVPLEEISTYFASTKYRIPKSFDVTNSGVSTKEEEENVFNAFKNLITTSMDLGKLFIVEEQAKVQELEPQLNSDMKIFMGSCRENAKTKKIYLNLVKAFSDIPLTFKHHKQENDLESCGMLSTLQALVEFNPNTILNIDALDNGYLPNHISTITIFTNKDSYLTNGGIYQKGEELNLRVNDYIFTTSKELNNLLKSRQINSEFIKLQNNKDYLAFIKIISQKLNH